MTNDSLVTDYIKRCLSRLKSLDVLHDDASWADVVRESQEVVELALKAVLRAANIAPPRIHDVSEILLNHRERLPALIQANLDQLTAISRSLRRDRELAFYGSEDLTPSEFYKKADADQARDGARFVVQTAKKALENT